MRLTGWYRFVFIEYGPELEEKIDPKNNTGFLFTTARMLRWQWCWWHRFVGDLMMVTIFRCWWHKKYIGDIFRYVGDIPIGHQHHNMPECDVGESMVTDIWCWCLTLDVGDTTCHQHSKLVTNAFGLQHPSPTSM